MRNLVLFQEGTTPSQDWKHVIPIVPNSTLQFDALGNPYLRSIYAGYTGFTLLPNLTSAAAGKDPLLVTLGTGTEIPARSEEGGVNLKTQVTTPAASDNVMLVPIAGSTMIVTPSSANRVMFQTSIELNQISNPASDATLVQTAMMAFAGLNQTMTNVDPTTDAGDGVGFLYAPNPGVGGAPVALTTPTGLAAGTQLNWILHSKIGGVDTFIDSKVPVIADQEYALKITLDANQVPSYYINGALVGVGAATGVHAMGVVIGEQIMNTGPVGQLDMNVSFVLLDRVAT